MEQYLKRVANHFSKLSEKKVKTKSDAYAVKVKLPKTFLLQKEYILEESDLSAYTYEIISETGISIKMKNLLIHHIIV